MSCLLGVAVGRGIDDVVVFEVDRGEVADDLVLASSEPGKVAARARTTVEEALAGVKPSLVRIVHMLREVIPGETTVQFGLKMGARPG